MTSPTFAFGVMLTVSRYGPRAKYGQLPTPTTHQIGPCVIAPAGSVEPTTAGQSLVTEQDTLYVPFDADVIAADEITIPDGQPIEAGLYQVSGKPQRYQSPFTGLGVGAVVRLTRTSG